MLRGNELAGFAVRIGSIGTRSFVIRCRVEGGGRTAPQHSGSGSGEGLPLQGQNQKELRSTRLVERVDKVLANAKPA